MSKCCYYILERKFYKRVYFSIAGQRRFTIDMNFDKMCENFKFYCVGVQPLKRDQFIGEKNSVDRLNIPFVFVDIYYRIIELWIPEFDVTSWVIIALYCGSSH